MKARTLARSLANGRSRHNGGKNSGGKASLASLPKKIFSDLKLPRVCIAATKGRAEPDSGGGRGISGTQCGRFGVIWFV